MNILQWIKYRIELMKRRRSICKYCYGKGYSSELRGAVSFPDFPGDKTYYGPQKIEKNLCKKCNKLTK